MTPISDARLEAQIQHKRDYIVKFGKVAAAREAAEEQLRALLELRTRRERDRAIKCAHCVDGHTEHGFQDCEHCKGTGDGYLLSTLKSVQEDICGLLCPSTWKTSEGRPPCSPKCQAVKVAIRRYKEMLWVK